MDRWILASTQTLIQYVRKEMTGYRLYTVVPGVVKFVDLLTNWYVRMNRGRFKGYDGVEECEASLNTMLQVMESTVRVLAPFTPFIAENLYQCLRPLLPAVSGSDGPEESVHYCMVPEVDTSLFDEKLEESMSRYMTIIELLRTLRNNAKISIRMPVKSITVVHSDAAYLESLSGLAEYIKGEINTAEVIFSQNEDAFVCTKLDVNFPVVGKKYKKEMKAITTELKGMKSPAAKAFVTSKGGMIAGVKLEEEDFKVIRETIPVPKHESGSDGTVVVLLNTEPDQSLKDSFIAREFVTRVQQMRKQAGLQLTDVVNIFYATTDLEVKDAIVKCRDQIAHTIRTGTWTLGEVPTGQTPILKSEEDVAEVSVTIALVKA